MKLDKNKWKEHEIRWPDTLYVQAVRGDFDYEIYELVDRGQISDDEMKVPTERYGSMKMIRFKTTDEPNEVTIRVQGRVNR